MRNAGRLILGFYPLPENEAALLRKCLHFPKNPVSALDPCVGDGVAFQALTAASPCNRYGIELDALRAKQAAAKAISVIHGDALEVRCPAESLSLLYLNPPYDFEVGASANRRLEEIFLRNSYRWLKRGGVLVLVIPQSHVATCRNLLAENFTSIRIYRLTSPTCVQYHQVAVLAYRRNTHQTQNDRQHRILIEQLETSAAAATHHPDLDDTTEVRYEVPSSEPVSLSNRGIPLDRMEDLLPDSNAYRQASRVLLRQPNALGGRPITQLHGGHVALLAASGALNGVFGTGPERHLASWTPARMFHHSIQREEDGTIINRKWSSFSPKLLLLYEDGRTKVLSHRKTKPEAEDDGQHELALASADQLGEKPGSDASSGKTQPRRTVRRHIDLRNS